jgi:hypothetical protein
LDLTRTGQIQIQYSRAADSFMVTATSAMPQVTQPGVREHVVSARRNAPLR